MNLWQTGRRIRKVLARMKTRHLETQSLFVSIDISSCTGRIHRCRCRRASFGRTSGSLCKLCICCQEHPENISYGKNQGRGSYLRSASSHFRERSVTEQVAVASISPQLSLVELFTSFEPILRPHLRVNSLQIGVSSVSIRKSAVFS
jgi:hypothetical protein